MNGTAFAGSSGIIQSSVNRVMQRGEKSALDNQYDMLTRPPIPPHSAKGQSAATTTLSPGF